jgi:molybdopterin synthase sulfur carrier subunit
MVETGTRDGTNEAPSVTVSLARALLVLFPEAPTEVEVRGASVRAVVDALDARWPGMRDRICDTTPAIRRHINVFVDGRRARLDTPLCDGIKIYVLTAISGG